MELGKFSATFGYVIEHNDLFAVAFLLSVGIVLVSGSVGLLTRDLTYLKTGMFASMIFAIAGALFVKNEWAQKNPFIVALVAVCVVGIYIARYYPYLIHKRTYAIR